MTEKIQGPLVVGLSRRDSSMQLDLSGDANLNAVSELRTALTELDARALAERCAEVVIDVSKLEFMSTSCFTELVTWLGRVDVLEPSVRYRITFVHDPDVHWQKRSMPSLQSFAGGLVSVEPK